MKNNLVKWLLFAYTFMLGIYMGGGIFETLILTPLWANSPEIARNWNISAAIFFLPVANLTTLLGLVTLIIGWNSPPPLRFWLRLSTILLLIMFVLTLVYFVPERAALVGQEATQNLSDAEILSRASLWIKLNYVRFTIAFVIYFAAFKALILSFCRLN